MFMICSEQGVHRIVLDVGFDGICVAKIMCRFVERGPVRVDLGRLQQFSLRKFMVLCQTFAELKANGADLEWTNASQSVQTLLDRLNHSIMFTNSKCPRAGISKQVSSSKESVSSPSLALGILRLAV